MSVIELGEVRAEIEAEREWREREIRLLRNHVNALASENERILMRKALLLMLYAHFEGICKTVLGIYVTRLNSLGVPVSNVHFSLAAAALADVFQALRDPNRKCKDFRRSLPDDAALHRFARDREFIEKTADISTRALILNVDEIVDTESNLKPVVFRKILYRLGLDPGMVAEWEPHIHQLLKRRNEIAHGQQKHGIEAQAYERLEQAVFSIIDQLVQLVSRAIREQMHLRKE